MSSRPARPFLPCLLATLVVSAFWTAPLSAQPTTRVSVGPGGAEATGDSHGAAISADGRWVAFTSWAENLVAGDTNESQDVFVHDLQTGATARVSVGTGGVQADGSSYDPAISGDGRWIAFQSAATNLVPGDTNGEADVFVHDRVSGTTARVSLLSGGGEATMASFGPSVSGDGRWIAFHSDFPFVAADTNGEGDIFVHDRQTGATTRVSVGPREAQANAHSVGAAISADGRWIAFTSFASNLVPDDTNGSSDVFLRDRETGTTSRVSVGLFSMQGNGMSSAGSMSADGRWIAFTSVAGNLDPGDTNNEPDVFVHDRVTGTTSRVNLGPGGIEANGYSAGASISADGRWVGFNSLATNLVATDTNGAADVFLHDRTTGLTRRASVGPGDLEAVGTSGGGRVSIDGRVAFESTAANLVPDDGNGFSDVFVNGPADPACRLVLVPASTVIAAAGGAGRAHVLAPAGCSWTATSSNPAWLTITAGPSGSGAGLVDYLAAPNPGESRTATIAVDGRALTVEQPGALTPESPTGLFVHAVEGRNVTLRWMPAAGGPEPTGFLVEAGLRPNEALVALPTGSRAPTFTVEAPAGSFYVRVRALNGAGRSAASNEIRVQVAVPRAPSAPVHLLAAVDGTRLTLAWTNTYEGGAPASVVLDVTGAVVTSIPMGLTESFSVEGVPPGTYRVAVRAVNATGSSARSSTLTIVVPGPCSGPPLAPDRLVAAVTGRTVTAFWEPAASGPAPSAFVLIVTGTSTVSVATTGREVRGPIGPGTYTFNVVAVNTCGVSATVGVRLEVR